MAGMKLSTPTISISVEFFLLRLCFVKPMIGNPRPKDKPPTECPRILGWNANNASTHHFKIPLQLALRVSKRLSVTLMHCIRCTKISQFSSSSAFTLFVRNKMAVQVLVHSLLVAYKFLPTRLWNSTNFS